MFQTQSADGYIALSVDFVLVVYGAFMIPVVARFQHRLSARPSTLTIPYLLSSVICDAVRDHAGLVCSLISPNFLSKQSSIYGLWRRFSVPFESFEQQATLPPHVNHFPWRARQVSYRAISFYWTRLLLGGTMRTRCRQEALSSTQSDLSPDW